MAKLCEKLIATKLEQDSIRVDMGQLQEVVAKGTNYLLVKLLTSQPFNHDAFKATMRKIWRPTKTM